MNNPALTASDRCDRCGAQAKARTAHESGPLLWCGHHLSQHRDVLIPLLVWQTPEIAQSIKTPATT
jgi:hypothetical protein